MKHRQLKKLCNKSVGMLWVLYFTGKKFNDVHGLSFCKDEGLHVYTYRDGYLGEDWECMTTWALLQNIYIVEHTDFEGDGPEFIGKKATPSNVFKWAQKLNKLSKPETQ